MAGNVIHFEIPIDDRERAMAFSTKAFGSALERSGPVEDWMTPTAGEGDGIGGSLTMRNDDVPSLMFCILVGDIDDALAAGEATGGTRLVERVPIPSVGWSASFEGPGGNKVSAFQSDPSVPIPEGNPVA